MPAAGATSHSFNMPSISQILHAIPKALVGFLAAFSGISNARSIVSPFAEQHGGGLQTEAHARWQSHWLPQVRACLTEPWTQNFDPDRTVVECSLRTIANWEKTSDDSKAAEVVIRTMDHYRPQTSKAPSTVPTGSSMDKLMGATHAIMRRTDAYSRIMEKAEGHLWFYSSAMMEDLDAPGHRYSASALRRLLKDAKGLEAFMEKTCSLSYQLHQLAAQAGEEINRLMPELMHTPASREAFSRRIDRDFVAERARMNNYQVNTLLRLLAHHMTARNARMVN